MTGDMGRGALYLAEGFRLIGRSGLRRFSLLPLFLNLAVFAILTWFGMDRFGALMDWLLPAGEQWWLVVARTVLWLAFAAAVLLIMFFSFTMVANLIGAPFNGLLAERVERLLTGSEPAGNGGGLGGFMKGIGPSVVNELLKLLYIALFSLPVLALSFVPVANIIVPLLWIALSAWLLALEYLGYPLENHGLRLRELRTRMNERRLLCFGFGLAVMGVTLLPVLNFFVMPAAVAGATAMWVKEWGEG